MAAPFAFQVHHIFPKELFDNPIIADDLASLLAGTNFTVDMAGNEIALFSDPQYAAYVRALVLDEPNASLDAEGEAGLTSAIIAARQAGSIVVVIAHRPNALAAVDHVLVMAKGGMVAFGPRDEVLRKTTVRAVPESA